MKTKLIILFTCAFAYGKAQPVSPDSAKFHEGSLTTICGKVVGTKVTSTHTTFINFGQPYPHSPFTAVIFAKDSANFREYQPAVYLKDKNVCVMGMVKMYKDKPEIIIKSPNQIRFPEN